jgi:alpha-ketoglutarate-dependent taurine dioxygenase
MGVRPLQAAFGVELTGLDLRRGRSSPALALIGAALRRHRLVVVPGQALTPARQLRVAAGLGTLAAAPDADPAHRPVPEVRYETEAVDGPWPAARFYNEQWHADLSWTRQGAPVTLLYAVEAAARGAPTSFADMVSAYSRLDHRWQSRAEGWHAYHHVGRSRLVRYGHPHPSGAPQGPALPRGRRRLLTRHPVAVRPVGADVPGVRHPVVQRDAVTGAPFVHLGDHAWTLAGHDVDEGRRLVDALNELVVAAAGVHRHRWRTGDLVLFDNRSLLHRREPWEGPPVARTLRRCVVWPAAEAATAGSRRAS